MIKSGSAYPGCRFSKISSSLIAKINRRLSFNSSIVAFAISVFPTSITSFHSKWSLQRSSRGLKSLTFRLAPSISTNSLAPFLSEQETHESARFAEFVCPPKQAGRCDQYETSPLGLFAIIDNIHIGRLHGGPRAFAKREVYDSSPQIARDFLRP